MKIGFAHLGYLSAIATCLVVGAPALAAQEAPSEQGQTSESPDIVVTATRRPQSLQKVPAAVTFFTGDAIAKISPTNIGAVLNLTPGVAYVGENTYRTSLTIRGVSGSNEDAAVAMYIDGIYVGHDIGQNLTNIDPESMQVLRGPQGALYGKNTLGGAVIVTSRKPSFDTKASMLAGYGNDNWYNVRGSLTGAIVPEKLAGYVFGYATGNDGRYRNIVTGKDIGSRRAYGGQAALLWNPSDTLSVVLRGHYGRDRFEEANRKGLRGQAGFFLPNQLSTGYNDEVALDYVGRGLLRNYGASLTMTLEAEPFTLTSITGYRGYKAHDDRDIDGTGLPYGAGIIDQKQSQYSQEMTLTSNGRKRFNWIAGIQLFRENFASRFQVLDLVGSVVRPGLGARVPVNYVYDVRGYETTSYAAYVQADYRLMEQLTLAGGVRYSLDDRNYEKTETQFLSNPNAIGFLFTYPGRATYTALTPEVSLTYEISPAVSLYGKFGQSYRPGGFNVNPTLNPAANNEFGKETANSYEIGLRSKLFDNHVTFNATAFRIDWKNQQISFLNQVGAFTVANVQSRSQGVEVEASAAITEALQLNLSGTYLDATFGHVVFPTRDPVTRAAFFADANGTPLNFAPKWSFGGSATYTHRINDDQKIVGRVDLAYRSAQSVQPLRPDLAGPAITRLNGRLEYDRGGYSIALWVKNALNRFSNYTSQSTALVDVVGLTEPRSLGIELGAKF